MCKIRGKGLSLILLFPSLLWANESSITSGLSAIKLSTYLDGSYNYLTHGNQFISGIYDRAFDIEENGVTLQQAAVTVAYQPTEGFGGLVNLIVGRDALTIAPYGYDPNMGPSDMGIDITQGYVQYRAGPAAFMLGQYVTLAGFETIDPTLNHQFSRSLLFTFAQPLTHLGFRATLSATRDLDIIIGLNNGWDSIRDFSRDKTLECGFKYQFDPKSFFSLLLYSGEEHIQPRSSSGPSGRRNLLDLVGSYQVSEKLKLAANIDYGVQNNAMLENGGRGKAIWLGLAAYADYQLNNQWLVSFRAENLNDNDGYRTGILQNIKEVTFTLGYSPFNNLQLRAEIREDFSNVNSFADKHGVGQSDVQQSFGLEAVYQFNYG